MKNEQVVTRLMTISAKMDLQTVTEESQEIYTMIDHLIQDIKGMYRNIQVLHYLEKTGDHSWKVMDGNIHCGYVHYLDESFGGCLFDELGYDTDGQLFDYACDLAKADYNSKFFGSKPKVITQSDEPYHDDTSKLLEVLKNSAEPNDVKYNIGGAEDEDETVTLHMDDNIVKFDFTHGRLVGIRGL